MRGKRSKQYRKLMQQYNLTFGFREPYQVLIDMQMLLDTARFKMDLVASLERTLHGQVKPMITQCTVRHLFLLPTTPTHTTTPSTAPPPPTTTSNPTHPTPIPPALKTALLTLSRTFETRRCAHSSLAGPLPTLACLSSTLDPKASLTNKNRYVLAVQDEDLRRWARGVRGVPSVYVKRSVMVMEPMSAESAGVREGAERGKLRGGVVKGGGGKRKREEGEGKEGGGGEEGERKKRKVRGVKGPNPLSVRKAKGKSAGEDVERKVGVGDRSMEVQDGAANIAQEMGEEALGGEKAQDSAGAKRKRRRKHKSGTIAGEEGGDEPAERNSDD